MKKILFIITLLIVSNICLYGTHEHPTEGSGLFSENKPFDISISARLSYPYILNANFSTILVPSILCRTSGGINASKFGIGYGVFDMITGGVSWTANYLWIYNDLWIDSSLLNRSFIGLEYSLAIIVGIDIGAYYSIDSDKKGMFLLVFGLGLLY